MGFDIVGALIANDGGECSVASIDPWTAETDVLTLPVVSGKWEGADIRGIGLAIDRESSSVPRGVGDT